MLIVCPECGQQVSSKAPSCPHCGNPLAKIPARKKPSRRMRLPNGFGQISEIKSKALRKPFRAMVSVGKNENGRPIAYPLKPESYFATYNEAYQALMEYHKNPFDLKDRVTMADLYERWSKEHFKTVSQHVVTVRQNAWKRCEPIKNIPVREFRIRHIKELIENDPTLTPVTQRDLIILLRFMLDYAIEYEMTDRNYARDYRPKTIKSYIKSHINYTPEEMAKLWNNAENINGADLILIQCYSGWRPQELYTLTLENINLEEGTMTGGMKTEAGTNRVVPIHSKIKGLVESQYRFSKEHGLVSAFTLKNGDTLNYMKYKYAFDAAHKKLGLNPKHRPHDGRVQFVTQAKEAGVDEYAIKRIVGHRIDDLTEKVYTKRTITWLKNEIEKIK